MKNKIHILQQSLWSEAVDGRPSITPSSPRPSYCDHSKQDKLVPPLTVTPCASSSPRSMPGHRALSRFQHKWYLPSTTPPDHCQKAVSPLLYKSSFRHRFFIVCNYLIYLFIYLCLLSKFIIFCLKCELHKGWKFISFYIVVFQAVPVILQAIDTYIWNTFKWDTSTPPLAVSQ